jgi:hypothetical protein
MSIPEPLKSFLDDLSKEDANTIYLWLLSLDDRDGKTIVIIQDELERSHCHLLAEKL